MERLIADANEYAKSIGQASNLSINSFSDVVTAIELVQEKQGIAGTTAREAATTIEGSLGMLKSAWSNLVTGFSDKDADLGKLINNVVSSAGTAFKNLMPVVQQAMTGIGQFVSQIAPIIADKLPAMLASVLPSLVKAAGALLAGLASALPQLFGVVVNQIPMLLDTVANAVVNAGPSIMAGLSKMGETITNGINTFATKIVPKITEGIRTGLPELISQGLDMLLSFSEGLLENSGTLIDSGISMIMAVVDGLVDSIPKIIETVPTIISNFANVINDNAPKLLVAGVQIIAKLAMGIVKAIPTLLANIPKILKAIWDAFTAFNWISLGGTVIKALGNGIKSAGTAIPKFFKDFITKAKDKITSINWSSVGHSIITLLKNGISAVATAIPNVLRLIASKGLKAVTSVNWLAVGKKVITLIKNGVVALAKLIPNALKNIAKTGINAVKNVNWLSVGKNIVSGLIKGVKDMGPKFITSVVSMAKGAFKAIKDFFGIHSPSRLMEKVIGENVVKGLIKGVNNQKGNAKKSAAELGALYVEAVQGKIDTMKKFDKISLAQEVAYWEATVKNVEKGTKAYTDARANLHEARKSLKEQVGEINKQYIEDVNNVVKNLDESVKNLQNTYAEAVEARRNAIMSFFGLFDEAKIDEGLTGDQLFTNLNDQINALEEWDKTLNELEQRIGGTKLYEELQNMNISQLNTLKSINQMSNEELSDYSELYDKKQEIAEDRSIREHEALKKQVDAQINELRKEAEEQIAVLNKQYKKDIKALGLDANAAFNKAGKTAIKGMQAGMSTQFDILERDMKARAQEIVDSVNAILNSATTTTVDTSSTSGSSSSKPVSTKAKTATTRSTPKVSAGIGKVTGSANNAIVRGVDDLIGTMMIALPNAIGSAVGSAMDGASLSINEREFARIVKAV
jgi:hypothetical protein